MQYTRAPTSVQLVHHTARERWHGAENPSSKCPNKNNQKKSKLPHGRHILPGLRVREVVPVTHAFEESVYKGESPHPTPPLFPSRTLCPLTGVDRQRRKAHVTLLGDGVIAHLGPHLLARQLEVGLTHQDRLDLRREELGALGLVHHVQEPREQPQVSVYLYIDKRGVASPSTCTVPAQRTVRVNINSTSVVRCGTRNGKLKRTLRDADQRARED